MAKDGLSITKFNGIDTSTQVNLIPPTSARGCLNVLGGNDGLEVMRQTRAIFDFSTPSFQAFNYAPIASLAFLEQSGVNPRLVWQTRDRLQWSDAPLYPAPTRYVNDDRLGISGRLDYALSNGVLYFSSGGSGGKVLPGDGLARRWGIAASTAPPTFTTQAADPGLTFTNGGRRYGYSYGCKATGHWSSLSPWSGFTGNLTGQSVTLTSAATDDWQVDQIAWFGTQDGQGVWLLLGIVNLNSDGTSTYTDTTTDEVLAVSGVQAPYDNGVSPNGKYIATVLDRVLMCGVKGDNSLFYSGYDTINFGRPQESWCRYNRIRLGEGKSAPIGIGNTRYGGAVIFCENKEMYLLKGTLSDITTSAPQSLAFTVESLPFSVGCYSHFSIQSTPAGVIWLDDGLKLRRFDPSAYYPPAEFASTLNDYFKRITPGSRDAISSRYLSYLNRDLYILSLPLDGSPTPSVTLIIDVSPGDKNTGAWPSSHSISGLADALYPDGTRHIVCAQPGLVDPSVAPPIAGYISDLPLVFPTTQGTADVSLITEALMPGAFWKGGYMGQDSWPMMKMFRMVRFISAHTTLPITFEVVDGDRFPFDRPRAGTALMEGRRGAINVKGRLCSPTVTFPDGAAPSPLLGLDLTWQVSGSR